MGLDCQTLSLRKKDPKAMSHWVAPKDYGGYWQLIQVSDVMFVSESKSVRITEKYFVVLLTKCVRRILL